MENRQTIERLLEILCEAYRQTLKILDGIDEYDALIIKLSDGSREHCRQLCAVISKKDDLITALNNISLYTEQISVKLAHLESYNHPMYQYMMDLQTLVYYRLDTLLNKEEVQAPVVLDSLAKCKESYELDIKLCEIPEEQKQIFMFVPEKKN